MINIPKWRFYRNLLFLLSIGFGSLMGLRFAFMSPFHLLWAIPLFFLAYSVLSTFYFVHPRRMRYWKLVGPENASPVYEKVLFKSRDGLTLFGWFLPGRNRAAIILVHGIGSFGLALEVYAAFLVRAGYNVLLMDLRAHGSSDGDTSTYGVLEAYDIAGAADYLLSRGSIDPDKIGVLGISLGAQAALRGALQCEAVRALVLEGLGPVSIDDRGQKADTFWRKIVNVLHLINHQIFEFLSGVRPTPLVVEIAKIVPRPILLIACGDHEIYFNRRFCAAAQESCTLWELPTARHAAALAYAPQDYPRRIVAFFDRALQPIRI